jgi:hypothetical protein
MFPAELWRARMVPAELRRARMVVLLRVLQVHR